MARRGDRRGARLTADQRAAALVERYRKINPRLLADAPGLHAGIANEIEAAEEETHKHLHSRVRNLTVQLECAVAAIKELRLKDAVRQSVTNDWYRNVAGRGVRLGLAALRTYAIDQSEQIRHETRANSRPHVESETRNYPDIERPEDE